MLLADWLLSADERPRAGPAGHPLPLVGLVESQVFTQDEFLLVISKLATKSESESTQARPWRVNQSQSGLAELAGSHITSQNEMAILHHITK